MAAAVEIASAYINLQTRLPGVKKDVERALGEADGVAEKSGRKWGKGLAVGLAASTALVATAATGMATKVIQSFGELEQNLGGSEAVFGKYAKSVQKTGQEAYKNLGISQSEYLATANKMGALFQGSGVKQVDSLKLTTGAMQRAADMASVMGIDMNMAMESVAGAAKGNYTMMDNLGVAMNQTAIEAYAAANGMEDFSFKSASSAEKADVAMRMFMDSTKQYAGNFAREATETVSGSFGMLSASWEELLAGFGNKDADMSRLTQNLVSAVGAVGKNVAPILGNMFSSIPAAIGSLLPPQVSATVGHLRDLMMPALEEIRGGVMAFAGAWQANDGDITSSGFPGMMERLANAGREVMGAFTPLLPQLGQLGRAFFETAGSITGMGLQLLPAVIDLVTDAITGLAPAVRTVVDFLTENQWIVVGLAAAYGAWRLVTLASTAAVIAQTTATKIASAAQQAWNVALKANPIGLIITAIGALVGALTYFFTQTEVGRKIWGEFTRFMVEAFENAKLWIKGAIDNIGAGFRFLWTNVLKPVGDAIIGGVKGIGRTFTWLDKNMVQPAWNGIKSALDVGRVWIDKHVFTPFKTGIDSIAKGFETAKSAIETTWNGIKKAAGNPINFVLDTIWNKGLRSFWNDVVKNLGLEGLTLKKATLIKFASGGVLPGWSPGRDIHQFVSPTGGRLALSGGEAIMRPEFTRAVGGPAGVDRLNRMARNGSLAFKDGGTWDPFRELGNFAGDVWRNVTSAADAAGKFLADPVKAVQDLVVSGIIKPLLGNGGNVFKKAVGQLPINLVKGLAPRIKGEAPKRGKGMGWKAMQDIVLANIPGARITSAYRSPLSNRAVGGAKASYHMQGRAIDIVPPNMATFAAVKRLFPNATELIFTPAGSGQLLNGKPHANWSPRVRAQHRNHIHLAMAQGGVIPKLYDQGGWLPHGGIAVNQSGKPEAVLTHDESQALKRGLGAGDRLYLVLEDGRELTAFVEERAGSVVRKSVPTRAQVHSQFGR